MRTMHVTGTGRFVPKQSPVPAPVRPAPAKPQPVAPPEPEPGLLGLGTITVASLNGNKANTEAQWTHDLELALDHASIIGVQEHERAGGHQALAKLRRRPDVAAYVPAGTASAIPIVWDQSVWAAEPGRGAELTSDGHAHESPNRHDAWQPLRHRASGYRVTVVNTHAVNGYNRHPGQAYEGLRDEQAELHWQVVVERVHKLQAAGGYDALLLVGDFNSTLTDLSEPWYPGPMLDPLFVADAAPHAIDHVLYSRGSHLIGTRRWSLPLESDHPLALRSMRETKAAA